MPIYIQIEQHVTIQISLNPHQYYIFSFFKNPCYFERQMNCPFQLERRFYRRVVGNKVREMGCREIVKKLEFELE